MTYGGNYDDYPAILAMWVSYVTSLTGVHNR